MKKKPKIIWDVECYSNYFLIAFKSLFKDSTLLIDVKGEDNRLSDEQIKKIHQLFSTRTMIGFNTLNYDIPVLMGALRKFTCKRLFLLSKSIIDKGNPGWLTLKNNNLIVPKEYDNIDIKEPSPGTMVSLKLYGARMHSFTLRDLPYDPLKPVNDAQIAELRSYCVNDLNTTTDLYKSVESQIELREQMSEQYGIDFRSKSDPQIAEAMIKQELNITGNTNTFIAGQTFRYKPPKFINFDSDNLKQLFEIIKSVEFQTEDSGAVKMPEEIAKFNITIGDMRYKVGIGGLHSTESSRYFIADNYNLIIDKDVTSLYPSIIIELGLYPKHLGDKFLKLYSRIYHDRITAKKSGNMLVANSYKLALNGSYGKFGSKYSSLYSPDLMIAVTMTGQLSLLMFIEKLELNGIRVISANTDGVVAIVPKNKLDVYELIGWEWELRTGFNLEATEYKALYSRDVNNYLAVTTNNKAKGKGIFTLDSLSKNPSGSISYEAAKIYLTEGFPVEETIKSCKDIRKFLHTRTVAGGAKFRDEPIGKVVRWIYSTKGDTLFYLKNGNKVPKSDGSLPLMTISGEYTAFITIPETIDFDRYIDDSKKILESLGIKT